MNFHEIVNPDELFAPSLFFSQRNADSHLQSSLKNISVETHEIPFKSAWNAMEIPFKSALNPIIPPFLLVQLLCSYLVGGLEHFLFFHILGIIIPTDFHMFQRGR